MKRSTLAIIIVIILLIAGGAIALTHKNKTSTTANTSTSAPSAQTSAGSVDIKNMMFTPSQVTVTKGTTVTWTNNDSVAHTVVDDLSNVGGPSSGDIQPGSTYSFTFNKTGSFQYHCSIHSSMRGTIVVH
jgi:plastocyanin